MSKGFEMHQWFYMKQGFIGDEQAGPFAEADFLNLVQGGTVGRKSLISSPTRTSGNWIAVESHPKLLEIWQGGQSKRDAQKAAQEAQRQEEVAKRQVKAAAEQQARQQARQQHEAVAAQHRADRDREIGAISDSSNRPMLEKVLGWVNGILTSGEKVLYIALQEKPLAVTPDAVVATSKRLIFFIPKLLGRFEFHDYHWIDLGNAHLRQDLMGSTFMATHVSGSQLSMDYLNKAAAQRLYRLCQEAEEHALRVRRERELEERRAGATNIQMGTPAVAPSPIVTSNGSGDLVQRLATLKAMFDQGLIEKSEFDERKQQILSQI